MHNAALNKCFIEYNSHYGILRFSLGKLNFPHTSIITHMRKKYVTAESKKLFEKTLALVLISLYNLIMSNSMKKQLVNTVLIISIICILFGCASTKNAETTTSGGKISSSSNAKITDWYKKGDGEKTSSPAWLESLAFGDGSSFLSSKGKTAGTQRFIVIAAGEAADIEDAEINATNDLQRAMATEMYLVFSIAMKDFTQDQKKQLFEACMKVDEPVKATKEGRFWRKIEMTKNGKTTVSYIDYEFYSITQEEFERQREAFLTQIFRMEIFDRLTLSQMITQYKNFDIIVEETSIQELSASKRSAWKATIEDCNNKLITSSQKSGINPLVKNLIAEYN